MYLRTGGERRGGGAGVYIEILSFSQDFNAYMYLRTGGGGCSYALVFSFNVELLFVVFLFLFHFFSVPSSYMGQ